MPSKDVVDALRMLRGHHRASGIITAIENSPRFPKDERTFDDLYELIVNDRAGFATTTLLANLPSHVKHDVYIHPIVIERWTDLRGYYTGAGITGALCIVCLDNPLPRNGWQLSIQAVQNAMNRPNKEFDVFIGYAIAPPEAMVVKQVNPGQRRWYY